MVMSRGMRCGIRLTHLPTGLHVDVYCDQFPRTIGRHNPALMVRARSWLAARVRAHRERGGRPLPEPGAFASPAEVLRNYHLVGLARPLVRQAGRTLATGDAVARMLADGTGLDGLMAEARRTGG